MPDLLLELFSEEIPARMQRQAADDLKRLVTNALVDAGLTYEGAQAFATPRRLTLHVVGLPGAQPDRREERKGPRVGAPEAAVAGFLKSAGLTSLDQAQKVSDGKKGEVYVAVVEKKGRPTQALIAELIPPILRSFPWPKSMRWGAGSTRPDTLRWVRPLRSILCTFGGPHEAPEVVSFALDGIVSGETTFGHRFLAPAAITARRFDDYADALQKAKVVLDADRRKQIILADARSLALAHGLDLVEDEGLLEEVAGLVEWPVVLMGEFEAEFLEIPPEVIRATIRANQKCFVLRDAQGKLANKFLLVSNLVARDGGEAIAAGNARVVRARLSDARHFWATDLGDLPDYKSEGKPLDQRLAKLKALGVIFHEKLGTQGDRVQRITELASELAGAFGADLKYTRRAAELAKADLVTEMVGEFPELQGLMGRYYAIEQNEPVSVAQAIEEHYKPLGPSDEVPSSQVSNAVALADKFDILLAFWAINDKPTGSKDPFALRRAALGMIRIIHDHSLHLNLWSIAINARARYLRYTLIDLQSEAWRKADAKVEAATSDMDLLSKYDKTMLLAQRLQFKKNVFDLLAFLRDRLKVYLRDKGARHDLIDAVLALPSQYDLLKIVQRVAALERFLATEDGMNLLVGYRRAANILKAEEKKSGETFGVFFDAALLQQQEERALADALMEAKVHAAAFVSTQDFERAMVDLSELRAPVDAFFTAVTVNADDPVLRLNRLRLLGGLRAAVHTVADFSRIAG